jgi:hypothetical protein
MGGQLSDSSKSGDDEKGKDIFFNLLAAGWEIGKTIPGAPNQAVFTNFGKEGGEYNLQPGDMVYIKDEKGNYKQIPIDGTWELNTVNGLEIKDDNGYAVMNIRAKQNVNDGVGNIAKFWANIDGKTIEFSNLKQVENELKALGWSKGDIESAKAKMTGLSQAQTDGKDEITILDKDKNSKSIQIGYSQDQKRLEKLNSWGFHEEGYSQLGLTIPGVDSEKGVHPTFSGTIYMPANITPQSISAYEQSFGVQHAQNVLSSGATANIQNTFKSIFNSAFRTNEKGEMTIASWQSVNAAMDFLNINVGDKPKEEFTSRANGRPLSISDIQNDPSSIYNIKVNVNTPWMLGENGVPTKYSVKEGAAEGTVNVTKYIFDSNTGQYKIALSPSGKQSEEVDKKGWINWYSSNIDIIRKGYVSGESE